MAPGREGIPEISARPRGHAKIPHHRTHGRLVIRWNLDLRKSREIPGNIAITGTLVENTGSLARRGAISDVALGTRSEETCGLNSHEQNKNVKMVTPFVLPPPWGPRLHGHLHRRTQTEDLLAMKTSRISSIPSQKLTVVTEEIAYWNGLRERAATFRTRIWTRRRNSRYRTPPSRAYRNRRSCRSTRDTPGKAQAVRLSVISVLRAASQAWCPLRRRPRDPRASGVGPHTLQ